MRRSTLGFTAALLLVVAAPLLALATNLTDDVIRMSRAGVDEQTIIAFVQGEQRPYDVTADDMIAMTNAKVSKNVVQAVIDRSAALRKAIAAAEPQQPADSSPEAGQQGPVSAPESQPAAPPVAIIVPPAPIPDYLADPFWYMPRLDTKDGASAVKPQPSTPPPTAAPSSSGSGKAAPPRESAPPRSHGSSGGHGGGRASGALLEVLRSLATRR